MVWPMPAAARIRASSTVIPANMRRHRGQAQLEIVGGVEHALLVFLQVLGIGERQALQHDQEALQIAQDPARPCHAPARRRRDCASAA